MEKYIEDRVKDKKLHPVNFAKHFKLPDRRIAKALFLNALTNVESYKKRKALPHGQAAFVLGFLEFDPKLTSAIAENLGKNVLLALTTTAARVALPASTSEVLVEERRRQKAMHSIQQFPATRAAVRSLLSNTGEWAGWDDKVYQTKLAEDATDADVALWKVLRIALVNCHMVLCAGARPVSHERTTWVDKVIPWFSPLRMTGLIQWKWCEVGYGARMLDIHAENDYATRSTNLADGLGLTTSDRYESVIMESSGHETKENVKHSLGEPYKTLTSPHLGHEPRCHMGNDEGYLIRNRLTLLRTRVVKADDVYKWQVVELRSAELSASWDRMSNAMRLAEIVATVYEILRAQKKILAKARDELCRLADVAEDARTVRDKLAEMVSEEDEDEDKDEDNALA
ncbi:hypothetical protein HDU86_003574 [Geranomyces michiganensis]|nr:hypothetical protein HDU86_003574 [Geranomyces michiganensis]